MANRRVLPTLSLAALLVLAGCGAPFGASTTQGPTPDAAGTESPATSTAPPGGQAPSPTESGDESAGSGIGESDRVAVRNGTLPFNATTVYRRVERLTNENRPAFEVVLEDRDPVDLGRLEPSPTQTALGLHADEGSMAECGPIYPGRGTGDSTVAITKGNVSAGSTELLLVHEFAHSFRTGPSEFVEAVRDGEVADSLTEAKVVYITDRYADRYDRRWNGKRPVEMRECIYDNAPGTYRTVAGQVYFGAQYVEARVDSPANFSVIHQSPPRTEEQVVHRLAPGEEPVRELTVTAEAGDRWTVGERRDGGEIELRAWLHAGLSDERVDTAATGWGAGRIVRFDGDDAAGVAWTLRMDSPDDADELAAAVSDLETDLEGRNATSVETARVGEETVVAFAGPEPFVANATASGTAGNVTVAAP
ncbi:hypothetical protein [Halosimplex halophilum]|uniref:hypothetical protein n=1 Tax=Halosimplex halophilum TaxID=2559572 RepID=UPI00107FCC52|nr:hypothetical protein [Halosimplex halophilum]